MQDSNIQARQGFVLWEEYPCRSPKTAMFVETDSGGEESQGASSPTWSAERDQIEYETVEQVPSNTHTPYSWPFGTIPPPRLPKFPLRDDSDFPQETKICSIFESGAITPDPAKRHPGHLHQAASQASPTGHDHHHGPHARERFIQENAQTSWKQQAPGILDHQVYVPNPRASWANRIEASSESWREPDRATGLYSRGPRGPRYPPGQKDGRSAKGK
jgi:hypothetical protein